jgi:hypothetical protein
MKAVIVPDDDGAGETLIISGDVERRNPIEFLFEMHVNRWILIGMMNFRAEGLITPEIEEDAKKLLATTALKEWPGAFAASTSEPLPQYLSDLLDASDKKSQIRLLKGATITPSQLLSFVCKAWEKGFTYSKYSVHRTPKGTDKTNLPHLFNKEDDGSIKTVGHTSMSDGQLKQLLDQRKVIVATILDKGDSWHCFFATYRGIAGKENYKGGQPHMHYISSKWGSVTRQQVIDGINDGDYVSNNAPHIDLVDLSNSVSNE